LLGRVVSACRREERDDGDAPELCLHEYVWLGAVVQVD
jgi:hypothetical protein